MPDDPRYYMDFTGTGNTLNVVHPRVLQLIMDSLRYWVIECHVDGFRFDLAGARPASSYDVDRLLGVLRRDPPGPGALPGEADRRAVGRRAGRLPGRQLPGAVGGVERQVPRRGARLLAGRRRSVAELASRLRRLAPTSTSDDGRRPYASINFVTAHDGFTLRDLVSYNDKHNEANGEDNRDGTDDNRSLELRRRGADRRPGRASRCARASSATSSPRCSSPRACRCCSAATSSGRTQHGNNNAYCQDNELSWFDWDLDADERPARVHPRLIALRREHPVFRRRRSSTGTAARAACPTPGGSGPTAAR